MGSKVINPQSIVRVNSQIFPTDKTKTPLILDQMVSSAIIEPELRIISVNKAQGGADGTSSSEDGLENVSYCEEDEAKLNTEVRAVGFEELRS